jgi:hypothetical protein
MARVRPHTARSVSAMSDRDKAKRWRIVPVAVPVLATLLVGCGSSSPPARTSAGRPSSASAPPPPPGTSQSASATPVVLPDVPPASSGCEGTVTAHHDIQHKTLGAVRVFIFLNTSARSGSEGCIVVVASSGKVLPAIPVDAKQKFGFANPATDATGNTFVTYNPGRYDGVLVLIPNADGFDDIGWDDRSSRQHYYGKRAYYYAELVGPSANGQYTIRQSRNDCTPSCSGGTVTTQDLHWNGSDYVP